VIREAKKMYYSRLLIHSDNRIKTKWSIVKRETGKIYNCEPMPSSYKIINTLVNPSQAADAFTNYFLSVIERLNLTDVQDDSAISHLQRSYPNSFPVMAVVPVTEAELIGIIGSLNNKTSSGYDGISNQLLKLCGPFISRPLSYIFNKSLSLGIFPDRLKYDVVKPLYKTGDRSLFAHYRPISLLAAFAKLFETIMFYRVNQHFQVHNILASEQFGFIKGLSTINAIYKLNR
jgi:hypothetical protein